ncbi:MAG: response regulator [Clostridiales Family XIII bacterium]|jgi:signal transduction histidine kinase/ActR/RegA family two-component response regulator|nr:response regulator [Clostridiales Family XIII bacterium]
MFYDQESNQIKTLQSELSKANLEIERLKKQFGAMSGGETPKNVKYYENDATEAYIRLLLDNFPEIIIIMDTNGRVLYCTDTLLSLCRISDFTLIKDSTYTELLEPYTDTAFLSHFRDIFEHLSDDKYSKEIEAVIDFGANARSRNYQITITPLLDGEGELEGVMAYFKDVTELSRAKKDAEKAGEAKSDFLATVSHEIRTPMNAIIGLAHMLKVTELSEVQHAYLSGIENSSHVLLDLINDILDFSKIEAGKLELITSYFNLKDLLKHIQSMFNPLFIHKGLEFICRFRSDIPDVVIGDDRRIRQILVNILNNALKYTEKGKIVFDVYNIGRDTVCFSVEDTGVGIKREAMQRLFMPFEQLDLVRNKKIAGTGLGLAITRKLCEMMYGSIEVKSTFGKGSTFIIKLPLEPGGDKKARDADILTSGFSAPDARVMLVDDIAINLQIAEFILGNFAIHPDLAESGQRAIELASQNHYDLIFMDHMMPDMDGIETTEKIRAMGGEALKTPIIALTANAASGAVEMFLANGFNDFLSKPIDSAALAETVLKWLPPELIVKNSQA